MKSYRVIAAIAVFTIVLLAAAAAYADPGDSGTVYGQATMQPTVSIALGGAGSSSFEPMVYRGGSGQGVWEYNGSMMYVTNTGDVPVALGVQHGSDPTDGSDTWALADSNDTDTCTWRFFQMDYGWVNVPASGDPDRFMGVVDAGNTVYVASQFYFPTSFTNTNDHTMTAIVTASEAL